MIWLLLCGQIQFAPFMVDDGAFSPLSRGSALVAWYKADADVFEAAGDPAEDGDPVLQWNDQSGNGRHIIQETAADKPLYQTNILNSLPAIQFVSTDSLTTTNPPVTLPPMTVYAVVAPDNSTADHFVVNIWTPSSTTAGWFLDWSGPTAGDPLVWFAVTSSGVTAITTSGFTAGVASIGTGQEISTISRKVWINGGSEGVNTTSRDLTGQGINRFTIGHNRGTFPLAGYVFEVIVTNVADDAAQRAQMEAYLDAKWNVP
jgi:hypothetical protein